MDSQSMNEKLIQLTELKNQLALIPYSAQSYDEIEEALHKAEDEFLQEFGSVLELALKEIHLKYCPGNEILNPIAYLAQVYQLKHNEGKTEYLVDPEEGVSVDCLDQEKGKLVLVPSPMRFILQTKNKSIEVWKA
jgi:hypothetical protein